MSGQKCSRNGCPRTTMVNVLRKINGHYYNIPLCRSHLDALVDGPPTGYEEGDDE